MMSSSWVHIRSPFVYWAQTQDNITLRVEIKEAKNPRIIIEQTKIQFDALGHGAQEGESEYHFEIELFQNINPSESSYRILDREINIVLKKENKVWWSKLLERPENQKQPAWLKIDFDRWKSEDDEDNIESETENLLGKGQKAGMEDLLKRYPDMMKDLEKEEYGYSVDNLRSVYLFLYNLFQFVGYLYIVAVLSIKWYREGVDATHKGYEYVGFALKYCQVIQFLEIIHPMLGFTTGKIGFAALQIMGRAIILFVLIQPEERIQTSPAVFFLFYFWSFAEIVRYPYYMLNKRKVYIVTWMRYSAWIVLYPVGFACEAITILGCIPLFDETRRYSITMPNSLNATFSLTAIMRLYLLLGIFPVLYSMMMYMYRARKQVLGTEKPKIIKTK